jgi:CHAT domain-containing protein
MYYHARVMMRRASWLSGGLVVLLVLFQTLIAGQDKPAAVTAVDTLADALAAAGSASERQALLDKSPALVTVDLRKALMVRASQLQSQRRLAGAEAAYLAAVQVSHQIGDAEGEGLALNGVGVEEQLQGRYAPALEWYAKALAVQQALGDESGQAKTLYNAGIVHAAEAEYAEALDFYQRALALDERIGDPRLTVRTLNSIALAQRARGDYALALRFHFRALSIAEAADDVEARAGLLNNLGGDYRYERNDPLALEYFERALKLDEARKDMAGVSQALNNIATTQADNHRPEPALENYRRSLAIKETLGDKIGAARTLTNIAVLEADLAQYDQALEHLNAALAAREALNDRPGLGQSWVNFSVTYAAKGDYPRAADAATRAVAISAEFGSPRDVIEARIAAGNAYRALKQPAAARAAFEDAIAVIEGQRGEVAGGGTEQARFFEANISPYRALAEVLIEQGAAADAFHVAESASARVLLDVLRSGPQNVTKAMTPAEVTDERSLVRNLTAQNSASPGQAARLQAARRAYEAFEARLYATHPALQVHRADVPALTVADCAALLPNARAALVKYMTTKDTTYMFVVTKPAAPAGAAPRLAVYPIPVKALDLAARVRGFREHLAARDLGFAAEARALYATLVKPAQRELAGKDTLVLVPDGVLWELPFQALQPQADRYLIEDLAISYAPSLTVLREMIRSKPRRRTQETLLAFGNPALEAAPSSTLPDRGAEFTPLPEAERQVRALGELYGRDARVYVGAAARETLVKAEAPHARILHLATHGVVDNSSPMYSYLALARAPADQDDGVLEAWELMKLDLQADVVVLSACETARGRVGAGEGVMGLTWALFVAGSPTTVVSQWSVESASTTRLMLTFHGALKGSLDRGHGLTGKARALQHAAVSLLHDARYRHPFYWAGFVLVGDGT